MSWHVQRFTRASLISTEWGFEVEIDITGSRLKIHYSKSSIPKGDLEVEIVITGLSLKIHYSKSSIPKGDLEKESDITGSSLKIHEFSKQRRRGS